MHSNDPLTTRRLLNARTRKLVPALGMLVLGSLLHLLLVASASAQNFEQTLVLQPGWNAVYLEVVPEDNRTASVFLGMPVASVWTYNPRPLGVEFVQDPAEGLFNIEGWLGYFPEPRPEAILSNLFIVEANRAYLIKLEGTEPFAWRLTGRPSLLPTTWQPDSFNLVGFHVNPSAPPSFGNFLAPSKAHAGQPIYELAPSGNWQLVALPFSKMIGSGKSYWVFCKGGSEYQGLLEMELDFEDGLQFAATLNEQRLGFTNNGAGDTTVFLRTLGSANPVDLVINQFDPDTGEDSWPSLPPIYAQPVEREGSAFAALGVRRSEFVADIVEQILEVSDSQGSRYLIPVQGQTLSSRQAEEIADVAAGGAGLRTVDESLVSSRQALVMRTSRGSAMSEYAGLWVGSVSVQKVSESQIGGTTPTPVFREFDFRVMVHVDGGGQARLLKEVIQMFEEGTLMPDPNNPEFMIVDRPSRYVLLTDDSLIPNFTGAGLRDGTPVGFRQSTVAYDFADQFLNMQGSFDLGGQLVVAMTLGADYPTNPFKHKYHPDHDNLDPQFLNPLEEALTVNRTMTFEFASSDPEEQDRPAFGDGLVAGIYRETLTGLHKNNIFVEGEFFLQRVASTSVLNQ